MKNWGLAISNNQYRVVLYEQSVWAWIGYRLIPCAHRLGETFWKIPVGKPVRDEEGHLVGSLAERLIDIECAAMSCLDWSEHVISSVNVTEEQAREISPDFVAIFEDDDE